MDADLQFLWSGRGDLNPRPPRPERGALPSCATSRRRHYTGDISGAVFHAFPDAPVIERACYRRALPDPQGAGERSRIGVTLYDCPWCGSAKSIEHGLCQVCLIEFPVETKVITLPTALQAFNRD